MTRRKFRAYLIEDEAAIAMLLTEYLWSFGYEVCGVAASGELAVVDIVRLSPDVIVSDIKLAGDMTGLQVARELRDLVGAPIIFVTAYATAAIEAEARDAGCAAFLTKPVYPAQLREAIHGVLDTERTDPTRPLRSNPAMMPIS